MRIPYKTIFAAVAGILLTLGGAAPAQAQAKDVVCTGCVASTDLADGTIANVDISTTAAIAGTKVAPNFGSQNVVTTGNAGVGTTSPGSRLDVVGALTVRGMAAPVAAPAGQGRLYYDSTANKFKVSQNGAAYVDLLGVGGSSQWTTSGTNLYYNTGNVGIGTATPNRILNVYHASVPRISIDSPATAEPGYELYSAGTLKGMLYRPASSNDLRMYVGGSDVVTFQNGGNVGIGTTGPTRLLHVDSSGDTFARVSGSSAGILELQDRNSATNYQAWRFNADSNKLTLQRMNDAFGTVNAEIWATDGVNVGIGTASPAAKLHIDSGAIHIANQTGYLMLGTETSGAYIREYTANVPIGFYTNNVGSHGERMRIQANGNVGIGTSDPQGQLHVHNPDYAWSILRLTNSATGAAGAGLRFALNSNDADIINDAGKLRFGTAAGPIMFLDNIGNVGIGTTGPGAKLHVVDTSTAATTLLLGEGGEVPEIKAGGTNTDLRLSAVGPGGWLALQTNGSDRVSVTADGNVGIGTTSPGVYKLAVKGKIHAEEVVVDTGWADFVFKKDYDLMPLEKVAEHIKEAGHLPGIPTEQEVKENGVSIGQIQSKLLQKIEEMTLYVIDLKKENDTLKERISLIENQAR